MSLISTQGGSAADVVRAMTYQQLGNDIATIWAQESFTKTS